MILKLPLFFQRKSDDELKISQFILKKFGYRPKNITHFITALKHKSFSNDQEASSSNERLEFLGDAILDAIVAELLYSRFPEEDEGYLTKIKSKIVNRKTLSEIGEAMSIRDVLQFNQSRSINMATLEGNAFEAIVGAIYLDGGYDKVKQSINSFVFRKFLDFNKILKEEIDFKSRLFIWCQRKKLNLEFFILSESHDNGQWSYLVEAVINYKAFGRGAGMSKKAAEQEASRETLQLIGEI